MLFLFCDVADCVNVVEVFYVLKTEVVDKRKLATDKKLMTSARWLAEVKPHFVYRFLLRHGWKHGGQPALIGRF
jgi:hypothetical protein